MQWNPESAKELVSQCGYLLAWDAPQGIEFGIDYNPCYTTGPLFRGMKLIPPGVHFIYYQVPNKEGGSGGPRRSLFLTIKGQQVVVLHWDVRHEELVEMEDKEQEERLKLATKNFEFDKNLAPYALENLPHWVNLSSCILPSTFERLQQKNVNPNVPAPPTQEKIDLIFSLNEEKDKEDSQVEKMSVEADKANPEAEYENFLTKFRAGIPLDDNDDEAAEDIPTKPTKEQTQAFEELESTIPFMNIQKRTKLSNADPERLTKVNFDKSFQFLTLANQASGKDNATNLEPGLKEVLSEFEVSFIMFVLGQSFEGFEQWKKFVELFSRCESAVTSSDRNVSRFFLEEFPRVLMHQIAEVPEDYFEDIVEGNNFLVNSLKEFFELTEDHMTPRNEKIFKNLKQLAHDKFGLQQEIEDLEDFDADENKPVLVSREELLRLGISEEELERILI